MANQENEIITFNKEEFYAAKRDLNASAFDIWCYLAEGNIYNKQAIAKLNGVSVRSIERGFAILKNKGYYIDDTFYAAPELENINVVSSKIEITVPSIKETVKVEVKSQKEQVQNNWIGKF